MSHSGCRGGTRTGVRQEGTEGKIVYGECLCTEAVVTSGGARALGKYIELPS
jgi:hypothetical protein